MTNDNQSTDVCPGCGRPTVQPIDAMAAAIAPWCRDKTEALRAAKDACDALVAHGYTLADRRAELDAAGIPHG